MRKIAVLLVVLIVSSCQQTVDTTSLDIQIEGMSCSHSCAPFIQKKLLNTEGVIEASVSFENKLAEVVINSNAVTKEEIIKKIESIANGAYKTGSVEERKLHDSKSEQSKPAEESKPVDFDITQPDVSHSSGFQLPNLFSLLNSILN